jgi:hypothetical protein
MSMGYNYVSGRGIPPRGIAIPLGAAGAAGEWEPCPIERWQEAEIRPLSAQQRLGVGHRSGFVSGQVPRLGASVAMKQQKNL